jgi:hypothetical protein
MRLWWVVLHKKERWYRKELLVETGIRDGVFFCRRTSLNQPNLSLFTVVSGIRDRVFF